jgi:adenosylcobinamide-phosphate synthase
VSRRQLALGLVAGTVLDALVPDPRRGHPVALFGAGAQALERRLYADARRPGVAFAAACVGGAAGLGLVAETLAGVSGGRGRTVAVAVATWAVLGGRSLRAEGHAVHRHLAAGDLAAARERVTHLVGRDPATLDEAGVARAALESVAENTADAVVAPLLWGAVLGVPGLLGYRAANTLDAMVGHRSPRYRRFGWAAARLDDAANLVPARVTALLVAAVAPVAGGDRAAALRVAARDGHRHPSPNSGYCEAAFAGALGLRLGGRNVYAGRVEERPVLGDGRTPGAADLSRATRLCAAVTAAAAGLAALVAVLWPGRPARPGTRR